MDTKRLVPLSGIAFVALTMLSLFVGGDTPTSGTSAEEVARYYDENFTRQLASTFVLAAAAPFVVLFGVSLAAASSSGWGHVARAGAILAAAAVLVSACVRMALVDGGDQGISPTALQALNALDGNTWIVMTSALGVLMIGAAGLLVSAGPRWLGWTALVLAPALFVPVADFVAMLVTAVWIVVTSLVLSRGGRADRPAGSPAPGERTGLEESPSRPLAPGGSLR